MLVGLSRDPQFGPVIAFGLGGIYTEVLRDVALRVAPVAPAEAHAMIRSLKAFPSWPARAARPRATWMRWPRWSRGCRSCPFRYPEIAELDLNPVFAVADGAVAGDVRVIRFTTRSRGEIMV